MFVFGEVQEPTTDTVNLIEDIVRSQLVELVRTTPFRQLNSLANSNDRSFKRVLWPLAEVQDTFPQRISFSSFGMTDQR